ncbi:MAG: substrate-binding domain-containing protein [Lentisphaeria bacterium]
MIANPDNLKHHQVFNLIMSEFSNYEIGDKLPSERELAGRLSVNIATIRRAFREFVLSGIVEKRVGSGTYLMHLPQSSWRKRVINLLLSSKHISAFDEILERIFVKTTQAMNRTGRVVWLNDENSTETLQACMRFDQPTIVGCAIDPQKITTRPELFVHLSSASCDYGIPSVRCDDVGIMNSLISHLRSQGCRKIALLCEERIDTIQNLQQTVWQGALGVDYNHELLIKAKASTETVEEASFESVNSAIKTINFDGLICLTDELMFGTLSALHQNNFRIPDDVAVTSIGDTVLARFSNPPVTGINPNAKSHIISAIKLLDYNHEHQDKPELLRLVKSELIIRKSSMKGKSPGVIA